MSGAWPWSCAATEPMNFYFPPTVIAGMNFSRCVLTTMSSCLSRKQQLDIHYIAVQGNGQPINSNHKGVVFYSGGGEDLLRISAE